MYLREKVGELKLRQWGSEKGSHLSEIKVNQTEYKWIRWFWTTTTTTTEKGNSENDFVVKRNSVCPEHKENRKRRNNVPDGGRIEFWRVYSRRIFKLTASILWLLKVSASQRKHFRCHYYTYHITVCVCSARLCPCDLIPEFRHRMWQNQCEWIWLCSVVLTKQYTQKKRNATTRTDTKESFNIRRCQRQWTSSEQKEKKSDR